MKKSMISIETDALLLKWKISTTRYLPALWERCSDKYLKIGDTIVKINDTHKSMSNIVFKYGKNPTSGPTEKEVERKGEELRGHPRKP